MQTELDKLEWWKVARRIHPSLTWEQFDTQWAAFQEWKAENQTKGLTHGIDPEHPG